MARGAHDAVFCRNVRFTEFPIVLGAFILWLSYNTAFDYNSISETNAIRLYSKIT